MTSQIREKIEAGENELVMCAFGSGLSWGASHLFANDIISLPVIEI